MYHLTKENLEISFDGHLWIKTKRQKTGTESNIRLLEVAKHIIEKYEGIAKDGKLLPVLCYPNCKNGIKAIAKHCGIYKNVTWHAMPQPCAYRTMYPLKRSLKCLDIGVFARRKSMRRLRRRKSAVIWRNCQNRLSIWNHLSVRLFNYIP